MTTGELVEKVARLNAVADAAGHYGCDESDVRAIEAAERVCRRADYIKTARRQIRTVLLGIREPSEAMVNAGIPAICRGLPATETPLDQICLAPDCDCYAKYGLPVTAAAWRAMIDAKLSEIA